MNTLLNQAARSRNLYGAIKKLLIIILILVLASLTACEKDPDMAIEFDGSLNQAIQFGTLGNIDALMGFDKVSMIYIGRVDSMPQNDHYLYAAFDEGPLGPPYERTFAALASYGRVLTWAWGFSDDGGQWVTVDTFTFGEEFVFGVSYDATSTANDPDMYIDGVSSSISEEVPPSGSAPTTAANVKLFYGAPDYDNVRHAHDGPAFLWAVFDRILTAEEHKSIAEQRSVEGHGPVWVVRGLGAAGQQDLDGVTLTSSEKIIEEINGYEGTPYGSPLGYVDDYLHVK